MKTTPRYLLRHLPRGIVSLPMIVLMALMLTSSLVFLMRRGLTNKDAAAHIQMRTDYRQREDAFVRALIAIVPNKAIGCMQSNSVANGANLTWNAIFTQALAASNGGVALSDADIATLLPAGARNANTGNDASLTAAGLLVPLVENAGDVVAGNTSNAAFFAALTATDAAKLPPTLGGPAAVLASDNLYPIISRSKVVNSVGANADYALSPANYPVYNQVRFPNVRLSFANPGDYVVGKRNWWAFSVNYGNGNLGTIKKNYLISIYELPNQLPISATAATTIGQFSDGTDWNGANVVTRGAVFADRLTTAGAMNFDRVIGRETLQLGGAGTIGGAALNGDVDALGTREAMAAMNKSNFLPAAVASNSGKVAFMALKRGTDFYTEAAAPEANTQSDTTWDNYTRGPNQCSVKVYVTKVVDIANQMPTEIVVHYKNPAGATIQRTFTRSGAELKPGDVVPVNYWPESNWLGGSGIPGAKDMPFQTEVGPTGRPLLVIYPERFAKWIISAGVDGAAVSDVNFPNNAIYIAPDPAADPNVIAPSFPSAPVDMAIVMRESVDLSPYTKGFSMVTNVRFYLADDANQVPIPQPANAGLPAADFYPPFSVFAPEYRVGTTASPRPFDIVGQIASTQDANTVFNPLDFKSGGTDALDASNQLTADLKQIVSPAELPPVANMNWLFTVEEIH